MSTSEMKFCPYCSEEIKASAIKCKHCQTMLDGSGQAGGGVVSGGGVPHEGGRGSGAGSSPGTAGGDEGNYKRLAPGVVINRYELKEPLGKGGMGEVFLAEHTYTGQRVALKAVWPNLMASDAPRKRFLQEGRVLAKLKQPNIVGLMDFFEEDGRFFLVMEYVEGETLSAYLRRVVGRGEALEFGEVVRILGGVLTGLSHAHTQTPFVVHRDIKPANVMLAKDGRVVLMDFGIARVAEGEKITNTAGVVGTYEYMSPEQVAGKGITPATDVYAVGILAYELLTGDVPFPQRDESGFDAMEGHKYKAPPPIRERRPDCPPALVAWVEKSLAKAPTERYRDAGEMLGALGRVGKSGPGNPVSPGASGVAEPPTAGPSGEGKYETQEAAGPKPSDRDNRQRMWAALVAVGVLVLGLAGAGGYGLWNNAGQVEAQRKEAERRAAEAVELERKRATEAEEKVAATAEEKSRLEAELAAERRAKEEDAKKAEEEKRKENEAKKAREEERKKEEAKKAEEEKRKKEQASRNGPAGLKWVYSAPAKLFFSKTEVTVAQYRACVEAGACTAENRRTKADTSYCNWGHTDRDQHPMNCLNWYGADKFCTWAGGRLPTEDEWFAEASNGGSRKYPWGDTEVTCDRAIWGDGSMKDGCGLNYTWPVCSKPAGNSVSGLCDMSGNVWEWTSSQESTGLLRGGSWFNDEAATMRASARGRLVPDGRDDVFGVRCVRGAQ